MTDAKGEVVAIRQAIELLSRHGYRVSKDGWTIVTTADGEREAARRTAHEELQRRMNERLNQ